MQDSYLQGDETYGHNGTSVQPQPRVEPGSRNGAAAGEPRGGERPMELKAFSRLMTSRSLGCRGQISEKEMNVTPPVLLRPAVIHQKELGEYQ